MVKEIDVAKFKPKAPKPRPNRHGGQDRDGGDRRDRGDKWERPVYNQEDVDKKYKLKMQAIDLRAKRTAPKSNTQKIKLLMN